MKIIGHRGCREHHATENTLSAFQCAIDNKLDAIEMDLHLSNDGYIVVHHDKDLKRIYDSDMIISRSNFKDLKTGTRYHKDSIVSLEETLKYIDGFPCVLEIKSEGVAEKLDQIIDNKRDNVVAIISFHSKFIRKYRSSGGVIPTGFLPDKKNFWISPFIARLSGAKIIGPSIACRYAPFLVDLARLLKLEIYIYPINSKVMNDLFKYRFKASYLVGDYPKKLRKFNS